MDRPIDEAPGPVVVLFIVLFTTYTVSIIFDVKMTTLIRKRNLVQPGLQMVVWAMPKPNHENNLKTTVPVMATTMGSLNFFISIISFCMLNFWYKNIYHGALFTLISSAFWTIRHCYDVPVMLALIVKSNEKKKPAISHPPTGLQFHD